MTGTDWLACKDIHDVKRSVEMELLARPGVTGVAVAKKRVGGVETDALAIVIYVARKGPGFGGEHVSSQIDGFPTDVVEATFVDALRMPEPTAPPSPLLVEGGEEIPWRGAIGGTVISRFPFNESGGIDESINISSAGAASFVAFDTATGAAHMLTAAHVLDNMPQRPKLELVATRNGWELAGLGLIGVLQREVVNGLVDVRKWDAGTTEMGIDVCKVLIAESIPQHNGVYGIGAINGIGAAARGSLVRYFSARDNLLKTGRIVSTDLSTVADQPEIGRTTIMKEMIEIEMMYGAAAIRGDSGSALIDNANRVVGILVAATVTGGTGVGCHIQPTVDAVKVRVIGADTGPSTDLHRCFNPSWPAHYMTTDPSSLPYGYSLDTGHAPMCRVLTVQLPGTIPCYQYYSDVWHDYWYQTDWHQLHTGGNNYVLQEPVFYLFAEEDWDRIPLYGFQMNWMGERMRHLLTTDKAEGEGWHTDLGIVGYAYPPR